MTSHLENRERLVQALKDELVGPSPQGQPIDCSNLPQFLTPESLYGPWKQAGSGEEILLRDRPSKRYGVGVLYSQGAVGDEQVNTAGLPAESEENQAKPTFDGDALVDPVSDHAKKEMDSIAEKIAGLSEDQSDVDFDISAANTYRPSTIAVSFLTDFPEGAVLRVDASGGRYRKQQAAYLIEDKDVEVSEGARKLQERHREWWLRSPVALNAEFPGTAFPANHEEIVRPIKQESDNTTGLDLQFEVFSRPWEGDARLLTVCLVNKSLGVGDELYLFQAHFRAAVIAPDGQPYILPYPGPALENLDPEEQSLALLYRSVQFFGTGHGCAADWVADQAQGRAWSVSAESLPVFETPSITPAIARDDDTPLDVSMAHLAGLEPGVDGFNTLEEVVTHYENWIQTHVKARIINLEPGLQPAANRHLVQCIRAANRMRDGISFLRSDPQAQKAFQLANLAILLQQLHARRESRRATYNGATNRFAFSEPIQKPDPLLPREGRGNWRPFQIAFILDSLRSVSDPSSPDRLAVELIWFPTGGGKTEAYLGLSSFALFLRRLRDNDDTGVHVLMRYTLRLLTAQQFQRAAGLLCAMEHIRKSNATALGNHPFSIGIWIGGSTTPNSRTEALEILHALEKGERNTENKFLITRCPWCGAQIGPVDSRARGARTSMKSRKVAGYRETGHKGARTVAIGCSDPECAFYEQLPVYVVDEDIYEIRPSIVIGTIDKFAMLAWKPEARALFGLNSSGQQETSPPGLIIQDELHLISGPLGSMAGLYEAIIDELCTDRRGPLPVHPKIVSSTATIRRYEAQIRSLYGREDVVLFPPPGIDAGDSFFARYARNTDGSLQPGRLYVGVYAPGLGSLQTTQVRTLTPLLQAPVPMPPDERDPWWTLVVFFNSLRELGTTVSLFQSDIPDYLRAVQNRNGLKPGQLRWIDSVMELTSRLRSDELPEAISTLEVPCTSGENRSVDVCLASNIIEVGIDIDRLSLMCVTGQPKTTSQYIQVTGRVGRQWWDRPGLVITIYTASKPRDRSHFEKFRSYHERLYAQVEPASVTPFSPPAVDRALHAAVVTYVRQHGPSKQVYHPQPFPELLVQKARDVLLERVAFVDPGELSNTQSVYDERVWQWQHWHRTRWQSGYTSGGDEQDFLLRRAGQYVAAVDAQLSWETPMSMRDVDAECQAAITKLYLINEEMPDAH